VVVARQVLIQALRNLVALVAVGEILITEKILATHLLHPRPKEILEATLAETLLVVGKAELVAVEHPPLEWIGVWQVQQPLAALELHHLLLGHL
jgi:hypothetical protein